MVYVEGSSVKESYAAYIIKRMDMPKLSKDEERKLEMEVS